MSRLALRLGQTDPANWHKYYERHEIRKASLPVPQHARQVIVVGRGLIGSYVQSSLEARQHTCMSVTRQHNPVWPIPQSSKQWWEMLSGDMIDCDVLIQATGTNILSGPLTPSKMREHYNSRVGVTKLLAQCVRNMPKKPKTFILTSSTSIYPPNTNQSFNEAYNGPYADSFLGEIFAEMEETARKEFSDLCERIVIVRPGHVLAPEGILADVHRRDIYGRYYLGRIGSGKQWFPWIHVADLANLYTKIVENEQFSGLINAVSPNQIQQRDIAEQIKLFTHPSPYVFPVPKLIANYLFTDRTFYLLESRKVESTRIAELNPRWQFADIRKAMDSLQQLLREPQVVFDADRKEWNIFRKRNKDNPLVTYTPKNKKPQKIF